MISKFSKLIKIKSKQEKELEKLQKKAKPYFDFVKFLEVGGIKFYQEIDLGDETGLKMFKIDPTLDEVNGWIVKYFEALKYIETNKEKKK